MSNNSDPMFVRYQAMDFTEAQPVSAVPALAKLQAEMGGKTQITLQVDTKVLAFFKVRAEMSGNHYQTLINQALTQIAQNG